MGVLQPVGQAVGVRDDDERLQVRLVAFHRGLHQSAVHQHEYVLLQHPPAGQRAEEHRVRRLAGWPEQAFKERPAPAQQPAYALTRSFALLCLFYTLSTSQPPTLRVHRGGVVTDLAACALQE